MSKNGGPKKSAPLKILEETCLHFNASVSGRRSGTRPQADIDQFIEFLLEIQPVFADC